MENNHTAETVVASGVSSFRKLLSYSIGEERSGACVEKLLNRYGSFATAFSAKEEELCYIGDINPNTALLIKLMAYVNSRRVTDNFKFGVEHTELEIREYISSLFLGLAVETVYALFLDERGFVVSAEHISDGTVNASDVVPRKILEFARRRNSRQIILAHNHPKGSTSPSKDDIMSTGRLFGLFATVGIRLLAHYIVADGDLDVIKTDMLYDPDYNK